MVLRRFPGRARISRNGLPANLQLAGERNTGESLHSRRHGLVLHHLQLRHAVSNHVGYLAKLRQRSLHHRQPNGFVKMDAISEHDDGRLTYHHLGRRSSSRNSAGLTELANLRVLRGCSPRTPR